MKQVIQDLKSGGTVLEEVPVPQVKAGYVLIQTTRTLVSLGTERMLVEFGKANLIDKARQQPDKVKQVLDKIKTDGLQPTLEAVFNKLGQPLPLGYCNVGKVVAVGRGVTEFVVGDRVASNGNHAEYVCVPKNLVAKIPDNVTDEEATFTVDWFYRFTRDSFVESSTRGMCCGGWIRVDRVGCGRVAKGKWL